MVKKLKRKSQAKALDETPIKVSTNQVYTSSDQLKKGIEALKLYIVKSKALIYSSSGKKDLLSAGRGNPHENASVFIQIVFKMIPANNKTYIHDVTLPYHWRGENEPEDTTIALFVKHLKPANEIEQIQFQRDRDLDIQNTHEHYNKLLDSKLNPETRSFISKLISTKELSTEYKTFKQMDKLARVHDLFLADRKLMINKMDPLPRRLGRRFWVRERKIPLSVNLKAENLQDEFDKVFKKQQLYVTGNSSSVCMQIGLMKQSTEKLFRNLEATLTVIHEKYGDLVRFIRLRTDWGIAIPIFADLAFKSTVQHPIRPKKKMESVVDDFDMLGDDVDSDDEETKNKIRVYADGTVNVIRPKGVKRTLPDTSRLSKKVKKN